MKHDIHSPGLYYSPEAIREIIAFAGQAAYSELRDYANRRRQNRPYVRLDELGAYVETRIVMRTTRALKTARTEKIVCTDCKRASERIQKLTAQLNERVIEKIVCLNCKRARERAAKLEQQVGKLQQELYELRDPTRDIPYPEETFYSRELREQVRMAYIPSSLMARQL